MRKRYLIYFILILSILLYFLSNRSKSTIINSTDFAVEDTSAINKIFLADRLGNTVSLERRHKKWIVNNKYDVRDDVMNVLLKTIKQVRIQRPVSLSSFDNVIKDMATTGIKVEIYTNQNYTKSYTIGNSTPDHLGTYMLLAESNEPYITHIPGFNGFLSPRYGIMIRSINVNSWRDTKIFKLNSEEVNQVTVHYLESPELSFSVTGDSKMLIDLDGNKMISNTAKINEFINNCTKLYCEGFKKDKTKIKFATPLHQIIVNTDTLRTYEMSETAVKNPEQNFNVKRMYATLNNSDLMLIQEYVFNKVLITIDELKR